MHIITREMSKQVQHFQYTRGHYKTYPVKLFGIGEQIFQILESAALAFSYKEADEGENTSRTYSTQFATSV